MVMWIYIYIYPCDYIYTHILVVPKTNIQLLRDSSRAEKSISDSLAEIKPICSYLYCSDWLRTKAILTAGLEDVEALRLETKNIIFRRRKIEFSEKVEFFSFFSQL